MIIYKIGQITIKYVEISSDSIVLPCYIHNQWNMDGIWDYPLNAWLWNRVPFHDQHSIGKECSYSRKAFYLHLQFSMCGSEIIYNYMSTCRMRYNTMHIHSLQFRFCMRNHIPTNHYNDPYKSYTYSHTILFHNNSCDSLLFHSLGMTLATIRLSDPSVFDYESEVSNIEYRMKIHRYHSQSNELYQWTRSLSPSKHW